MKEIMAIIRMDMIGKTKEALAEIGFPSITCKRVLGRGKKKIDFSLIKDYMTGEDISAIQDKKIAEQISEVHRLISKRLVIILSKDEDVKKIVDTIIETNRTGNPGDGKIFVIPVTDSIRIRTEEIGDAAI
ncbi:P-II family nitrogen regulator [Clostridium tyrobutyricum]|jgi:nitrogen regulatory protein PII 2|uniref:Nitrogen regulatory protein P-II n=1 Tax=Clostridium tyrobutyricum DIVETGP TaxID=1408889 RepID=W6N5L0_CLOTY|nr:P-II family nitrogen regulator [Clostridium tyrobutyricum]AND86262.1 nitrogen regulatory protein PII [Clostridium tyrobutyricum]ANP70752.1 nitrogen fixation protein [Clostridium tyrobutyricum]MBR9648164.1 P-II family nitrogen regulator [Clostridium tyrobutyricum]MBV4417500.1 P-II family nitrogen regulator [Clostridium tyrobutyricum]MBV4423414.1 P-II family nitrogen regulator [Clostridium tyrobutyricum]